MKNEIVSEILTDAYSLTLDEQMKIFEDSQVKPGIEEVLSDDDTVDESPDAAIVAMGFLKAIYLMERFYADRKQLVSRIEELEHRIEGLEK